MNLVIWCCWDQCEHHMTLLALLMTPFCFLGQDDWNQMQHDLLVMCCQCWHITLMASSIASLHLLVQDDQNENQHDVLSHLTLLALASTSCDANGIISTTIVFKSRSSQGDWCQCATYLYFWSCNAISASISVAWYQQCPQWHHSICEVKMIKRRCSMTFVSCNTICISINIIWCQWHQHWHQFNLFSKDNWNLVQHSVCIM